MNARHAQTLVAACLALVPAGADAQLPEQARDWLEVRRGGADSILAAARVASAPQPWQATYSVQLPAGHPLAGKGPAELRLTVARDRPTGKKASGGSLLIRVDAPTALKGAGFVVHGGAAWLRTPGGKPEAATPAALFAKVAGLGVPWIAFAPFDIAGLHSATLEGEFGDIAVLRGKPEYLAGPAVAPVKAGVSKRHGCWVVGEVTDRQGKTLALVQWLEVGELQGIALPERLRLRGVEGEATALDLRRQTLTVARLPAWGPKLLR